MSTMPVLPAWPSQETAGRRFWWSPLLALSIVMVFMGLMVWNIASELATIRTIPSAERYELRVVPADDPKALRFDGPLVDSEVDAPLPLVDHEEGPSQLRKARLVIDLDAYLEPSDSFDDTLEGNREVHLRGPSKAILVSQAVHGLDVFLNGVWLDGFPRSTADDRFMWFRPIMVPLPAKVLRPHGPNRLTIEYTSWEPHLTFSPVYVGEVGHIAFISEVLDFIGGSLANASKAFCLLTGLFMVGIWMVNRRDDTFGLIGAVALLWATVYTLSLWVHLPASWRDAWLWAFYACTGSLNALTLLFVLRFIQEPLTRPMAVLVTLSSSAAAVISPFLGSRGEVHLAHVWIWLMLPLQVWVLLRLVKYIRRTRSRSAILLLLHMLLAGLLIVHDFLVMAHQVSPPSGIAEGSLLRLLGTPIYLTHLVLPPLLIVMARVHLLKYGESIQRVKEANQVLADSLRRREMELTLAYDRQSGLERREAAQEERERLYRELHDGIGSRLVTTLFSVRDGHLNAAQLEQNLLDLLQGVRSLVSNSPQREEREFQNILFDYCVNLDSLLSGKDFQLEYEVPSGQEFVLLEDGAKELLRVVEETVANTLKYANATRVTIRMQQTDHSMSLRITDNGRSALAQSLPQRPAFGTSTGMGLTHMRKRMESLGGQFDFQLTDTGAVTRVELPLVQAAVPTPARVSPDAAAS